MTKLSVVPSPMTTLDDDAWEDLLSFIEERRVIPIVGPELLIGLSTHAPDEIERGLGDDAAGGEELLEDVARFRVVGGVERGHDHDFVRELMLDGPSPEGPRSTDRLRAFARRALPPRQQPAIRTIAHRRASDGAGSEELGPMRIVRGIYRYPIKGLSPQRLPGIELEGELRHALADVAVAVNDLPDGEASTLEIPAVSGRSTR